MNARLRRLACFPRSALGFAVFGVCCVVLQLVVLPLQRLGPAGAGPPGARAQRSIHRAARFFFRYCQLSGALHIQASGGERLGRAGPQLVVANHPTLLDFIVLCSLMPQADCIVSRRWIRHFPLRGLALAAHYVPDDDPAALVRECAARLRSGRSVVVFPEGTRSPVHGLGPFRRGAARVALAAGCELLPVTLAWDPPVLFKGAGLRDLPDRRIHATVRVGDPIAAKPSVEAGASPSVASRRLTAELREFFLKGLEIEDVGDA